MGGSCYSLKRVCGTSDWRMIGSNVPIIGIATPLLWCSSRRIERLATCLSYPKERPQSERQRPRDLSAASGSCMSISDHNHCCHGTVGC
jgi:hypothetical protein